MLTFDFFDKLLDDSSLSAESFKFKLLYFPIAILVLSCKFFFLKIIDFIGLIYSSYF